MKFLSLLLWVNWEALQREGNLRLHKGPQWKCLAPCLGMTCSLRRFLNINHNRSRNNSQQLPERKVNSLPLCKKDLYHLNQITPKLIRRSISPKRQTIFHLILRTGPETLRAVNLLWIMMRWVVDHQTKRRTRKPLERLQEFKNLKTRTQLA